VAFDARAQIEAAAPAVEYCGRASRKRGSRIFTSRVFKRRAVVQWQHLRDVRNQFAAPARSWRANELVQAVVVEERERVGSLPRESVVREVRGEERDSFSCASLARLLEVFGLTPRNRRRTALSATRRPPPRMSGFGASSR